MKARLWIKRAIFNDWNVCAACVRRIPLQEITWLDKEKEEWYCHSCAMHGGAGTWSLTFFTFDGKLREAQRRQDESVWIVILFTLAVCIGFAVLTK